MGGIFDEKPFQHPDCEHVIVGIPMGNAGVAVGMDASQVTNYQVLKWESGSHYVGAMKRSVHVWGPIGMVISSFVGSARYATFGLNFDARNPGISISVEKYKGSASFGMSLFQGVFDIFGSVNQVVSAAMKIATANAHLDKVLKERTPVHVEICAGANAGMSINIRGKTSATLGELGDYIARDYKTWGLRDKWDDKNRKSTYAGAPV